MRSGESGRLAHPGRDNQEEILEQSFIYAFSLKMENIEMCKIWLNAQIKAKHFPKTSRLILKYSPVLITTKIGMPRAGGGRAGNAGRAGKVAYYR